MKARPAQDGWTRRSFGSTTRSRTAGYLQMVLTATASLTGCGSDDAPGAGRCEDVDCSGHGTCTDVAGAPACECDAGYTPASLECVQAGTWQASLTHVVDNPGLSDFPVFGAHLSEMTVLELFPFPSSGPVAFTAVERIEQAIAALPLESCATLEVGEAPEADCLDAGALSLTASWPGFDFPPIPYSPSTDNYPVQLVFGAGLGEYAAGAAMELRATGGADVASFAQAATSMPEVRLITPAHDSASPRPTISRDEPLVVEWAGQDHAQRASIVLAGQWATHGAASTVGCNVENDGAFTIPASALSGFVLGQVAHVSVTVSDVVSLSVPELPGGYVRVASRVSLLVHYDPEAVPAKGPEHTMAPGYASLPCSDDSECGGGICAADSLYFAGGYCTVPGCVDDQDCPSDAKCYDDSFGYSPYASYCAKICDGIATCDRIEPVYDCVAQDGWGACIPSPG